MGCGKTTLGRELAKIMRRPFTDLDEAIEKDAGMSVYELFRTQGEEHFRNIEKDILKQVINDHEPKVVALGGGTLCEEENSQMIRAAGFVVYIRIPILTLAERLEPETAKRPLLEGLTGGELIENIEQRLLEREKFYEGSHLAVNGINLGAAQLLRIIQSAVRQGNI